MKRYLYLQLTVCAALALVLAGVVRAQDTPAATDAEKAFQKFKEAAKPDSQAPPFKNAPEDEAKKWWGEFCKSVVKEADVFLAAYPKDANANEVRLVKSGMLAGLCHFTDDAAWIAKARDSFNEVLKNQPNDKDAFTAYFGLMRLPGTPVEDAAKYMATMKEKFPKEERIPQLELFMVSAYLQAGKTAESKKAAQSLMDVYSKEESPMHQRIAMQAEALLKKIELIGTPLELKFTALDGKEVDIKNYRGKVVLIDFWATWCGPCRAELPNVLKAYAAYHDKGFEILGISLDRAQDKEELQKFLADQKMTWPQYFDQKGGQETASRFGVQGIPATFLVGKDGKVARFDLRGEALSKAVAELLAK